MKFLSSIQIAFNKLSNPDPSIRKLGAQQLCKIKPTKRLYIERIQKAFVSEKDDGVAKWLAYSLGLIGDVDSLSILKSAAKALPNKDLRDWVLVSVKLIENSVNEKEILKKFKSSDSLVNKEGLILSWDFLNPNDEITRLQKKLLENSDPNVRRWASLALGTNPSFIIDEQILEHLKDPDYLVSEWTEHIITGAVPDKAIPILIENLKHNEPRVREWAIKALASVEKTGILNLLIEHYKSETDNFCKEAVLRALGSVGYYSHVYEFLIKILDDTSEPIIVAALIDILKSNDFLFNDKVFFNKLKYKIYNLNNESLQQEFDKTCLSKLPEDEQKLLKELNKSKPASNTWNILTNQPWRNKTMELKTNTEKSVIIIIPLKEEFRAFIELISEYRPEDEPDSGKSIYHFEIFDRQKTKIKVQVMFLGGMGSDKTTFWAQKLNSAIEHTILVNIGIAGGIDNDLKLGDIVVANQIEMYISDAKAVPGSNENGFKLNLGGDTYKTDGKLVNKAQNFEFRNEKEFSNWETECKNAKELLSKESLKKLEENKFLGLKPRLFEGHIASGPIVGSAEEFGKWLKDKDRNYLMIEMEAGGGALALYENNSKTRYLVIRGISDFADERKNKMDEIDDGGLRKLAMQNASRFLLTFLKNINIKAI